MKKSLAPRRCAGVSAPFSPARNRSQGVFRVTVVRRKVAVARRTVMSLISRFRSSRRVGLGGLLGKRVPEQLPIGRELLQFGGLELQHPVRVEQQQRHAFLRGKPERVEAAGRLVGLAGEPAHQEAVVEGGADRAGRIARDAVQGVESTGSQQRDQGAAACDPGRDCPPRTRRCP